jgi:hypothetical protein
MDELGLHKTWQGLRLLAVDGSSMHLPLEDPLARHFGTNNGLPVARVSVLQDLPSDQALHTLLITPDVDERSCASMLLTTVRFCLTEAIPPTGSLLSYSAVNSNS